RRMCRKQVFKKVARFDAHPSQVHQLRSFGLSFHLADAAQQPFHTNKVRVHARLCIFHQERAVAASELHLEWLNSQKHPAESETLEDGRQLVNYIGWCGV